MGDGEEQADWGGAAQDPRKSKLPRESPPPSPDLLPLPLPPLPRSLVALSSPLSWNLLPCSSLDLYPPDPLSHSSASPALLTRSASLALPLSVALLEGRTDERGRQGRVGRLWNFGVSEVRG